MDSYQAIYDATRSKIGSFNGQELVERIASNFDISYAMETIKQGFLEVTWEMQRPSTMYKPKLYIDGDRWCALYGINQQDGVAGFGDSPAKAMENFDKRWADKITA